MEWKKWERAERVLRQRSIPFHWFIARQLTNHQWKVMLPQWKELKIYYNSKYSITHYDIVITSNTQSTVIINFNVLLAVLGRMSFSFCFDEWKRKLCLLWSESMKRKRVKGRPCGMGALLFLLSLLKSNESMNCGEMEPTIHLISFISSSFLFCWLWAGGPSAAQPFHSTTSFIQLFHFSLFALIMLMKKE